jgi:hypothetical protein
VYCIAERGEGVAAAKKYLFAVVALLSASAANADWHGGKIIRIQIAYDGSSVVFVVAGHTRNNCTCYAAWPDTMCLNRSRASFKEEVAMLYMTRARGGTISYNIDENTCQVQAMYETD